MNNNEEKNENVEAIKIIDTEEKAEIELEPVKDEKKKTLAKELYSYLILIIVAFVAAQVIHNFIFTPVIVDGDSMKPNLYNKDVVFLSRFKNYERFDVVVFEAPDKDYYIKRLIGLPGDYVSMVNDKLYINDVYYEEPYLEAGKASFQKTHSSNFTPNFSLNEICYESISRFTEVELECNINGKIQIPQGYYLVLGDNRPYSNDSTELGLISADHFIGEAKFVLYPFKRIGKIK